MWYNALKLYDDVVEGLLDGLLLTPDLQVNGFFRIMQGVLNYVGEVLEIAQRHGIWYLNVEEL